MYSCRTLQFIAFSLALIPSTAAWSQVARPATVEPGRASQPLTIEERPEVGGPSIITYPDENGQPQNLAVGATFELKGIKFENLTAFSEADLASIYEPLIGTKVTLASLNQMANKITVRYRNAGYILSRAVIPPQHIKDGIVIIRIVEGFISGVEFQGIPNANAPSLLASYAHKIQATKPLDAATLERYLLLMNDLPGVTAQAVLRPSANVPGASDVIVTITQKTIDGSATVDNRGSRYLGPVQGGLDVGANNLLGIYDRTELRGVMTDPVSELKYGEIVHEEQLDSEGTKLALSGGYTHTRPGYKLESSDIVGRDTVFSADLSHPFLRSRQSNIYGDVKFDIRDTDLSALQSKIYDDHLKVLRAGGSYDFVDSTSAVNRAEAMVSKGFQWDTSSNGFGLDRPNADPSFVKATATVSRLQPVYGPVDIYVAATGQMASDALESAEQFGLGGAQFGSAYDSSELVGDSGAAGRIELQYNRSDDFVWVPSYQLYGFYDGGKVWTRTIAASLKSDASLVSTGAGVRFNAVKDISGGLEVALPVTRKVAANGADGSAPRVFFNLAYKY